MISVCIATYNGEKYIKEQLDSILSQLSENDEIIISDNYSTDSTIRIINEYNDRRIRIFQIRPCSKNSHISISFNFENALKHASGDFIFLADQDDVWNKDKINIYMRYFRQGYELIVSDFCLMRDGKINLSERPFENKSPYRSFLLFSPKYFGCCMAFTKRIKDLALPFPNKLPIHDSWIGCLAEFFCKVKYVNMPLIYYRIHGDNISVGKKNTLYYKIYYRLSFYCSLLRRVLVCKLQ